jgi:phosphate transport system permease protein
MSTTADPADFGGPSPRSGLTKEAIERRLRARHRAEARFRALGLAALLVGIGMVGILFYSILEKGIPAFTQAYITLDVTFDPERVDIPERPEPRAGQSEAEFQQEFLAWQRRLALVNWNALVVDAIAKVIPAAAESPRDAAGMIASNERLVLRQMVADNPSIIGTTQQVSLVADAEVDVWLKGNIDRELDQRQQQLSRLQQEWADDLYARGIIDMRFASTLFTQVDSRSSPATAGLLGAIVGSLYMMLIVLFLSVPIGVFAAIYLEEFAPRNRITDFVEVNINNLAAVPSIVFGLLGAAVFIKYLGLPLSAPLVGGLVLTLMTLPTIIIASRAALRAVPPSIRQAALGVGASPMQAMFHHTLPLAVPGILTGAILGVANALGETAPLLLIGMSAFVASVPASPMDPSTALPVTIFLWEANEARNFFEGRTSAAIIILLGVMMILNLAAIILRHRFSRRW